MQNKRQDYHYPINENSCVIALCVFPLLFHANCLSDFHRGIASNDSTHHFTDSGCPNLQPLAIPTAIAGGEGRNRPDFPAIAPLICLISLGIQAKTV